MRPKLSIIIPCYNSEATLEATLDSVSKQEFTLWEAILVNDGSKDNLEDIALDWVNKDKRFRYYKKDNGGLGTARNYGITKALGEYILPLDSDNTIKPDFAEQAIHLLQVNPKIGVVYGNAEYFGERTGTWKVGVFDKFRMLKHNYIDACAIIKKDVFDSVGLYDTEIPFQGHEDWEFWLRVMQSKYEFFYLNKITFNYRVTGDSMIKSFDGNMLKANLSYIKTKHAEYYFETYNQLFLKHKQLKKQIKNMSLFQFLKNRFNE